MSAGRRGGAALVALVLAAAPAALGQGGAAEDRDALWDRGHRLYQQDELDAAEEAFRTAEALGPHWYGALMLGAIAERRFEFRRALAEYRRAVELDPTRDATRDEVARVEAILSDLERFRDADRRLGRELGIVVTVATAGAALALLLAIRG